ncbi:MAG: hypothetical protein JSV62_04705 [Promethearchaeota archaeon]|nr:MAG: hypothetical protein JSV62_04705 [Candidatus Lokiarchaeota archaeon]
MQKSKIELGSWVILFLGIYTTVMAILWIFLTEIMFVSDFGYYTGQTYQEYLVSDPRFAEMYIITKKLIGVMLLIIGLLILEINQQAYRKGERWAWFALLLAGGLAWGTFIVYKIVIGYIGLSMITFAIGATLVVVGIALPAKEILGRKSA